MKKFIIFANARTGSTSLAHLLEESPDVSMCMEPFHIWYSTWFSAEKDYRSYIKDETSLHIALDEIFSKYNAIKCLSDQLDKEIYLKLLNDKTLKILFLTRKNPVLSAISFLTALQTNIWRKSDLKKHEDNINDLRKPIQLTEIEKIIRYLKYTNKMYGEFIQKHRQGDYMPLFYEDLFSYNHETNVDTVKRICKFLEIEIPADQAIDNYMNPELARINKDGLYKKIPNLDEIESKYGKLYL